MKGTIHVTWRCCVCSNLERKGREAGWHATSVPTWRLRVPTGSERKVENGPPSRVKVRAENTIRAEWNEKCDRLGRRVQSAMRWFSLFLMLGGMQAWFFCRD